MKLFKLFIIIAFFYNANVFSQKTIKHTVKSGESIYLIAKKYNTTEAEIFELNPSLKGKILALKTEVKVPNKDFGKKKEKAKNEKLDKKNKNKKEKEVKEDKEITEKSKEVVEKEVTAVPKEISNLHTVTRKETLYSIAKQYGVTMETLCELNPELKTSNLRAGLKIKLPTTTNNNEIVNEKTTTSLKVESKIETSDSEVIHKVVSGETLYKIARKYGVSVKQLQKLNPNATKGLKEGFDLIIKSGTPTQNVSITDVKPVVPEGNSQKADFLIAKASEHLGTHYRGGGTTENGYDCSGLMFATFSQINITLPRSSAEQSNYGVRIDRSQAKKGDLIFFTTNGRGNINHVGMVTEVLGDEIRFIHSSVGSGVIISSTNESYYSKRFVQVNRVLAD